MKDGFVKVAVGTPVVRVADCLYNAEKTIELIKEAEHQGVQLLVLPELGLTGATCGDLFFQPTLFRGAEEALGKVLDASENMELLIVVGLPVAVEGKLYGVSAVCQQGAILGLVPALRQDRWFSSPAKELMSVTLCGQEVPMDAELLFRCRTLPELTLAVDSGWSAAFAGGMTAAGATVVACPDAEPEMVGRAQYRCKTMQSLSASLYAAWLYAGAGEGESTSDQIYGGHGIVAEYGELLVQRRFGSGLAVTEVDVCKLDQARRRDHAFEGLCRDVAEIEFDLTPVQNALTRKVHRMPFVPEDADLRAQTCEEILTLAALGLKGRLEHTGAKTAVLGLSGGLDSTLALLTTVRAMDLLGRERKDILAVTMPCFGTTARTRSNAEILAERCGCTFRTVAIGDTVNSHFNDIGQSMQCHDVTFENAQARERTQVLMDLANMHAGLVVGTGDLSELALGWATYNGDHMSMYGVNGSIPKTLVRHLVQYVAQQTDDAAMSAVLEDILATPVSPELLPAVDGEIAQKTEDLVGPYELHDFFLYHILRWAESPTKILRLAQYAWGEEYDKEAILHWLRTFYRRFFAQQFKRNCLPDGPAVGSVAVSPRGSWVMPSDAVWTLWRQELEQL